MAGCPAMEGDDVTVGCYGQYDWLSYWLQYNPVASVNSTIQFLGHPATSHSVKPALDLGGTGQRPPPSINHTTSYTFQNVQRGQHLNATCQIDFTFDVASGYSGRNTYANNPLQWQCSVHRTVSCEYFHCLCDLRVTSLQYSAWSVTIY